MELMREITALSQEMSEVRRHLHQNPELSGQEFQTTQFLKEKLTAHGIRLEPLSIPTGLSALIQGGRPGPTICIRHDIDALPIQEETGLPFASACEGVSHACGHDIHATVALYCAILLQERREELRGNVRGVFQPAEENGQGAKGMVQAGLMELLPKNDIVVGLHTHPLTPVGDICLRKGPMEAGADCFQITVTGKGGHGAYPWDCVDPIAVSASLITQLQTIISRENPAIKPAVLTIASIHGGNSFNSIPSEVVMQGSLRTLYPESREHSVEAIRRITRSVCEGMNAAGTVQFSEMNLPPITNNSAVVDGLIRAADETLGEGHVREFPFPSMGSDDFAVFLQYSKGAQFFLGTANEDANSRLGLHKSKNIFDERSIPAGVAVLTRYVLDELGGE